MSSTDDILGGASSDGQAIGFKRHLFAPSLIFLALEIVGIAVPLMSFFGDTIPDQNLLLRIGVPIAIGAQLIWTAMNWHRSSGNPLPRRFSNGAPRP